MIVSVVVITRFLSVVVSLAVMSGFTRLLPQLLARLSTLLDSGHPPSSTNLFCILLHLLLPDLLRSFSLSLATYFKIESNPQNTIVIPSQHMSIPSNSIGCCQLVYSFPQPQHVYLFFNNKCESFILCKRGATQE